MNYSKSFSYAQNATSTYTSYYASNSTINSSQSSQQQTTSISLSTTALRSPHILTIQAAVDTRITGKIIVNGVEVRKLQAGETTFNLVPYLTKGDNQVEILGEYRPAASSVAIKFSGSQTQVSQQVGGNGKLKQTLIITVR